jgi:hypothetical protein
MQLRHKFSFDMSLRVRKRTLAEHCGAVEWEIQIPPIYAIDLPDTIAEVQTKVRRRLLRAPARRGLLEPEEAAAMGAWALGGGFSLDASVRIDAHDRGGLERLLHYCARPAFYLERLREIDAEHLVYDSAKPGPGGALTLKLTPLELLDRLAALIPPPHRHRHRYFGILAPNDV